MHPPDTAPALYKKEVQFTRLLVALVLLFAFGPILDTITLPGWSLVSQFVWLFLIINVMSWALLASSPRIAVRRFIFLGMAAVVLTYLLSMILRVAELKVLSALLLTCMLIPAIISATRFLFSRSEANAHTISASACIYILMALSWASAYALIAYVDPEAFHVSEALQSQLQPQTGSGFSKFMYFSLVTITTLGYGDITPVSAVARSLSALEAFVGPFYLAVIVARLVALQLK